jgi:hypothetical protein
MRVWFINKRNSMVPGKLIAKLGIYELWIGRELCMTRVRIMCGQALFPWKKQ